MPPIYLFSNVPSMIQVGTTFITYLLLDLSGAASVGHEVSVRFTPDVLSVVSAVELGAPPFEMHLNPGVRIVDNTNGIIVQFEGASLTTVVSGPNPVVVGAVTFVAIGEGKATIEPFFSPGAGVLDDVGYVVEGVQFLSSDIRVVKGVGKSRRSKR